MERSTWQGTKGGLWPTAINELNPANNYRVHLKEFPAPLSVEVTVALAETLHSCNPEPKDPIKPFLTHSNRQKIHSPVRLSGVINGILCVPELMPDTTRNFPRIQIFSLILLISVSPS